MSGERARNRASVAVIDERKRVLLVHVRDPADTNREFLLLPGGEVEDGEHAEAAAARELYEETGIAGVPLRPVADAQLERFTFGGRRFRQSNAIFVASVESANVAALEAAAGDVHSLALVWLTRDELAQPPLPVEPPAVLDLLRPLLA